MAYPSLPPTKWHRRPIRRTPFSRIPESRWLRREAMLNHVVAVMRSLSANLVEGRDDIMQEARTAAPDTTAVWVALWRALHVQIDPPPHVLEDEIGLALAAPDEGWR